MKQALTFLNYLADIDPKFEPAVRQVHDKLTALGCKVSVQAAKSGAVVSFAHPQTDKVMANFIARKTGPMIRLYADNVAGYQHLLEELPEQIVAKIAGAGICRRMHDPTKCNARCPMGYQFTLRGETHKKCRYNAFLLRIDDEATPSILTLVESEMALRA